MRIHTIVVIALIMAGCASVNNVNNYQKFYKQLVDSRRLQDVEVLQVDQEPQLVPTTRLDSDIKSLRAKQYILIGSSSFNGRYQDERMIKAQAARVGATVVLVYAVPTKGHVAASQQRYDQVAVFFVKSTKKLRFGVSVIDLDPEQRSARDRNTGALVDVVMENSPAFTANVLPGDILVEVNGVSVLNATHAVELMLNADVSNGTAVLKVIRKGEEKVITITFKEL